MEDFLRYIDSIKSWCAVHVEIYYNKICDWTIRVYKKGCAEDYPNSKHWNNDAILCDEQDCDMELCFAKAHVAVKKWLSENEGGY